MARGAGRAVTTASALSGDVVDYSGTLDAVHAMQVNGDGTMRVVLVDGRIASAPMRRTPFLASSAIASSTYFPALLRLWLETVHGNHIVLEVPAADDLAPRRGRPAIYLDQNHWSTLSKTIHSPDRVPNQDERIAAERLIAMVLADELILPLSAGHVSETCKQVDPEERYQRALTMSQLSAGWQLRDPLALRRLELRRVLTLRYQDVCLLQPPAVTLEPNAMHSARREAEFEPDPSLPADARWVVTAISAVGGMVDTLLDAESVPMPEASGWAAELQRFATFLKDNPTEREMRRRRTHAKFIVDLGTEIAEEAHAADLRLEEMSDWTLHQSESDLRDMPALGLFREVLHERLCDPKLQWVSNDLVDMMYLTAGAAYCDHIACERQHAAFIDNSFRRMDMERVAHRSLHSLVNAF